MALTQAQGHRPNGMAPAAGAGLTAWPQGRDLQRGRRGGTYSVAAGASLTTWWLGGHSFTLVRRGHSVGHGLTLDGSGRLLGGLFCFLGIALALG